MIVVNGARDGWVGSEYIGRSMPGKAGSALANPFKTSVHTVEAHEKVVAQYRKWLWAKIKARDPEVCEELAALQAAHNVGGEVRLACWCKPLPCHGDVVKACIEWASREGFDFI